MAPLALDPAVTFTLDGYEPVAFHTYPALMRAAEARTEVLVPAEPVAAPTMPAAPRVVAAEPVQAAPQPAEPVAPKPPVGPAPPPVAAYLVGINATAVLRQQLADFLDAAGARQDVRVSVGVSGGSTLEWVLRDAVPYGVRALPRYPPETPAGDPTVAIELVGRVLADDALSAPDRRRLLVLVWGAQPVPLRLPGPVGSALVLHCVDVVLDRLPPNEWGPSWLLARSRPRPGRSLLAQAGRLLTGWDAFTEVADGLILTRLG